MSTAVERAVNGALRWLKSVDAPESAIAMHEHDRAESPEAARRWMRRIVDQERDGRWDDELLATVRSLLVLRELRDAAGLAEQDPAVGRALDWLRSRKGAPGAWTDGCDPDRHRRGLCHHFAAGFFSPAPPDAVLSRVDLPSGARTTGEAETRFAISAVALRCTLLWRGSGTDARLHLEVLRRVLGAWERRPEGLTTTALLCATHALLASGAEADRRAAEQALHRAAGQQRGDGTWVDADLFHALAVFGAARDAGVGGDRVAAALEHGARLFIATQREDGSWGPDHGPRRALIALRTIRRSQAAG